MPGAAARRSATGTKTRRTATRVAAAVAIVAAGCSAASPTTSRPVPTRPASPGGASSTAGPATTTTPSHPATSAAVSCPQRILATLSEAQRVGQLFMVGEPLSSPDAQYVSAVKSYAVGGVILFGTSHSPVGELRALTDRLRATDASVVAKVGLYVATDQEGGQIQELSGPGFNPIPAAVTQGVTDPTQLQALATRVAAQLTQAGVNVNLAPVLDVVPPDFEAINQPIAAHDRQLGSDPAIVATHGVALVRGLQSVGVGATLKHFPGLGRVAGNTDTTAGVQDTLTTQRDPFLAPFASGINAGADFVMISLATYRQIDPGKPAVFSSIVMRDMLRRNLGFRGLIVSDDLGSSKQVIDVAPGQRAISYLNAGGDIVLVVKPASVIAPMVSAVQKETVDNPTFRQLVDNDTMAVLTAKQKAGLLDCR